MTYLTIYSFASYLTSSDVEWRRDDYNAMKVVKSFKDEQWNGWLELPHRPGLKLDYNNRSVVRDIICSEIGREIQKLVSRDVVLVPVPDSATVVGSNQNGRAHRLSHDLSRYSGSKCSPLVAIQWRKPRNSQRKAGGLRRMDAYIDQLAVVSNPERPVVLVDDMVTSGSQMLACANILEKRGCSVLFGVAVGRRAVEQVDGVFTWLSQEYRQEQMNSLFEILGQRKPT